MISEAGMVALTACLDVRKGAGQEARWFLQVEIGVTANSCPRTEGEGGSRCKTEVSSLKKIIKAFWT